VTINWETQIEADLKDWIGRSETQSDRIEIARAQALLRTLGDNRELSEGDVMPSLFHWLYFWSVKSPNEVGVDGHAKTGGLLPPHPLPRRMWAGGRLNFLAPIRMGDIVQRCSTITAIKARNGQSGRLVFITVKHRYSLGGECLLEEEQDIVFLEPATAGVGADRVKADSCPSTTWHSPLDPDEVLLFRYSALTMNSHRIHYDSDYAHQQEGYPFLVVHGPLQATMLARLCEQHGRLISRFDFRGQAPAFANSMLHFCGEPEEGGARLWAEQNGKPTMMAQATWA